MIQHAFEPFCTTKPGGDGFGLATVYGIVSFSGGTVRVTSALGDGAAFDVFLPVACRSISGGPWQTPERVPVG